MKQPDSDTRSFLTNTHPPTGPGDTWQPGQAVRADHHKTSIFPNSNLCSTWCFPWQSTLRRAIKRWLKSRRSAVGFWVSNHVSNVKVNEWSPQDVEQQTAHQSFVKVLYLKEISIFLTLPRKCPRPCSAFHPPFLFSTLRSPAENDTA